MAARTTVKIDEFRKRARQHSRITREAAYAALAEFVDQEKQNLIDRFLSHPVTQELQSSPGFGHSGLLSHGTLWGFIGFEVGSTPVADALELLNRIFVYKTPTDGPIRNGILTYYFNIEVPLRSDIVRELPLPFWSNKSWVEVIETGLPNIAFYKYTLDTPSSRSKEGVQIKVHTKFKSFFTTSPYLPSFLRDFRESLKLPNTHFSI